MYDIDLRLAPYLGQLTETEFIDGLVGEVMRQIVDYTEDGRPVRVGPFPTDMLRAVALGVAECTRAYDRACDYETKVRARHVHGK